MRRWLGLLVAGFLALGWSLPCAAQDYPDHLTGVSFQKETGTKFQFVPYRGNGPAMQDQALTFSSFCRQRRLRTSGGIGVSGKLVVQLVTPTSPT
jgi:hypothetical protein